MSLLEREAHFTALGVRLRDELTRRTVADGLTVSIVSLASGERVAAQRMPSGLFGVHRVRGLRRWELRGVGPDGEPLDVPVDPVAVRIEVRDRAGRFHAFAVDTELPADGVLVNPCLPSASPATFEDRCLPLFSLPSRPPVAGHAVVRARLRYEDGLRPAAYAALEIVPLPGAEPVRGIADERGEVVVMFPYPQPPGITGSPPAGTRLPLARTAWTVAVRVLVPRPAAPPAADDLPGLCSFLDQIPAMLVTVASPPAELGEATIEYGRELVLRSSPDEPALFVRP